MNFKYKNLSKSLVCMLMPMLVACGGNSRNNSGAAKEGQKPDVKVELHTSEMDSVLARYNHQMDSVEVRHNKLGAAADTYNDIYNIFGDDYVKIAKDNEDMVHLKDYMLENYGMIADSLVRYDWDYGYLDQNKIYLTVPALEAKRTKTALDSLNAQYDRAVVAEKCYLNAWDMVLRGYEDATSSKTYHGRYNKRYLAEYSAQKLLQFSDSVAVYRARQQQLLAKKAEMQKTK